jgi:hypothetical protein
MKKIRLLALLWVILVAGSLAGCGGDKESNNTWDFIIEDITWENDAVINYNDTLVDLASECIISEDNIWNTYDNENSTAEDVIKAIDNTISQCSNAWNKIDDLWDWEWDSSLKDWVLDIIEKEINYYSKFKELLPYLEKEELTEEEKTEYDAIYSEIETLDKELSEANENLMTIQEKFASDYGFELEVVEEETSEEVPAE